MATKITNIASNDLLSQREYVEKMKKDNFDFSLVIAAAFVRGIRDIGYKSTGTALDELIDNSLQAEADRIDILIDIDPEYKQISKIALVDNGHGMDPDMIRLAMSWGGTHREDDRKGFGRYGYGLPSSAVSQGKRYTVYSKPSDGKWYKNTFDVDEVSQGKYLNKAGKLIIPEPSEASLPEWLIKKVPFDGNIPDHGTIVVLEKLDRLDCKTTPSLQKKLLEHFGLVYRNFLRALIINVEYTKTEPIDPLFITPGYRFVDENNIHAEALTPTVIDVKDPKTRKPQGIIKVRYAFCPPNFTSQNPDDLLCTKLNNRFNIMRETNGLNILRNGRQIDVIEKLRWSGDDKFGRFLNNDRYIRVEVDFPATLDEEFSVTTSKQTVNLSSRIWDLLEKEGVHKAITEMRNRYKERYSSQENKKDKNQKRASEEAMATSEKFKPTLPPEVSTAQKLRADEQLQKEAEKKSQETGVPVEEIKKSLIAEAKAHPYKVIFESLPGAPFFRVQQIGGLKVLSINESHRFFLDLYRSKDSTPFVRSALEVLLFTIGDCELDSNEEHRKFYEVEKGCWSTKLSITLEQLNEFIQANKDLEKDNS